MGKRIISQRRGRGTHTYKFPGFKAREIRLPEGGEVVDIVHDRAHSTPLAKIRDNDKTVFMPATEGIYVGQKLDETRRSGNVLPLSQIAEGTNVCNIEVNRGDRGSLVRTSGAFARVVSKEKDNVVIKLPSGAFKTVSGKCRAIIGVVAGGGRHEKPLVKAGKAYYKMKAKNKLWPRTSPIHMNAVDHPFGGGRHPHVGKPQTSSKNAPPGRKVGYIGARRTGKK